MIKFIKILLFISIFSLINCSEVLYALKDTIEETTGEKKKKKEKQIKECEESFTIVFLLSNHSRRKWCSDLTGAEYDKCIDEGFSEDLETLAIHYSMCAEDGIVY